MSAAVYFLFRRGKQLIFSCFFYFGTVFQSVLNGRVRTCYYFLIGLNTGFNDDILIILDTCSYFCLFYRPVVIDIDILFNGSVCELRFLLIVIPAVVSGALFGLHIAGKNGLDRNRKPVERFAFYVYRGAKTGSEGRR